MKNAHDEENWPTGRKIGQDLAKTESSHPSTHGSLDALRKRIRKDTSQYFGRTNVPHYVIRLSRGGKRTVFILTSSLDESAKKAREIKAHLSLHGWSKTVAVYCAPVETETSGLKIGRFLELARTHMQVDPITFSSYASKFRQVVAGVMNIGYEGSARFSGTTQPSKWRLAVNEVPLDSITPVAVLKWRSHYLEQKSIAQKNQTKAQHTANAIIRNARSLFSEAAIKNLLNSEPSIKMPALLPFAGVDLIPERDADYFYISEVNVQDLIRDAFSELTGEVLVIFALALGGGLRRKEIDNLTWSRINLSTGVVLVAPTATAKLKSDHSLGEVKLEREFVDVLRHHAEKSKGDFVLRPDRPARVVETYCHYRCDRDFEKLCRWLAKKGIQRSTNCVHTLRKEFGSWIAAEHGIHKACASLRQSSISLTAKHYTTRKSVPTSFFEKTKTEAVKSTSIDTQKLIEDFVKKLEQDGYSIRMA